jgi:hypothetical protein
MFDGDGIVRYYQLGKTKAGISTEHIIYSSIIICDINVMDILQ